ncbi:FitA-like ribbon-helix-helix domain-containing protein [Methylobacterium sp. J-092]|uniref:FitA-like ribbon-helix-helix domain-containing protein n=1 Tax=Methylobacterium sp. J-092 TaxID=2836667 RepID=UPI001FBA493A|nr:plasmid stabilization protein [Methylobacterium sp. J-092]MCJ2005856.1 plasmid stabilization protein [Methylobacterium sp. J-092]
MAHALAPAATITIRNLDGRVKERLRIRAAMNGRSMEAEARSILAATLAVEAESTPDLAEAIRRRVAPFGGIDLEEHPAVTIAAPPSFDR